MYSLALIIFVVSEKKAFEHFPIGSNVNLCIAVVDILDFKLCIFCVDRISKMTTTAGQSHSFYIGPIGSFYNQVNDTGS
jgi:hypothetical protein